MPYTKRLAMVAAAALAVLPVLRAAAQAPAEAVVGVAPNDEKRHYVVERVVLNGLAHTNPAEVRRRILVEEGDVLDDDDVLLSRLRLLQLGWFARVETRVERGSERGKVLLVFDLTERNTLLVSDLVFGSTEPQPFYAGLGLSQQNFLGRGLGLSGAFAYGGSPNGRPADPARFALRGAFFAPDLEIAGLPPIVLGLSGLWLRGEELACAAPECAAYDDAFGDAPRTQYRRAGGELTVGFRPGPFERLLAGYRVEAVRSDELSGARGGEGRRPFLIPGQSLVSAITGAWELDTRDDFFFPREGWRSLFQLTFASRLLGGDYEYSRYSFQVETAYALFGLPLRAQATVGAVQGAAPFFDRFYAADHSYFAVGPALGRALELNFSTDSRYDAFLAALGVEYAVPVWSAGTFFQRGYLAFGARALYSSDELGGSSTQVSDLPFSVDVALRFDTPVGTFNASFGYALDNVL
jgi:outer membrane protein insertion porin family